MTPMTLFHSGAQRDAYDSAGRRASMRLCGETCHLGANLIGAYRGAIAEVSRTGDCDFWDIAEEAERALRILLTKLRLRQAGYIVRWE